MTAMDQNLKHVSPDTARAVFRAWVAAMGRNLPSGVIVLMDVRPQGGARK